MRGNITRRGKSSWRLKLDLGSSGGQRQTRYVTVRGKRQDAERELTRLIAAFDNGSFVEPTKVTVADYLRAWLNGPHGLAGKTAERYWQLAEQQIIPHLGNLPLQKLRPAHVADWHTKLVTAGGKDGRPLSAQTTVAAHRVLHRLLARAVAVELLPRNVASAVKPPKVEETEVESLTADQIGRVLKALEGHYPLQPIAVLALSSGARRGEILALAWKNVDLDATTIKIERSLEQTKAGLKFKAPKTKHGRRTVALPLDRPGGTAGPPAAPAGTSVGGWVGQAGPRCAGLLRARRRPDSAEQPKPGLGEVCEVAQAAGDLVPCIAAQPRFSPDCQRD